VARVEQLAWISSYTQPLFLPVGEAARSAAGDLGRWTGGEFLGPVCWGRSTAGDQRAVASAGRCRG